MTWLLDRLLCIVKVGTDVIHERPQYSTSSSYEAVSSLLAILLASLEPLTEAQLHAVHSALYCGAPALSATQVIHLALLTSTSVTCLQVRDLLSPLAELVVTRSDGSLMCIHPTLRSVCLQPISTRFSPTQYLGTGCSGGSVPRTLRLPGGSSAT